MNYVHLVTFLLQEDAKGVREASRKASAPDLTASATTPSDGHRDLQEAGISQAEEAEKPLLLTNPTAVRRFKFTLQSGDLELECQASHPPHNESQQKSWLQLLEHFVHGLDVAPPRVSMDTV